MKTWEMIKKLSENPKLRATNGKRTIHIGKNKLGIELIYDNYGGPIKYFPVGDEWELVKEPVDFMTAVNSGKKIKPKFSSVEERELNHDYFEEALYWLRVEQLDLKIVNGKWLIEN
jgi:hypothetical protein